MTNKKKKPTSQNGSSKSVMIAIFTGLIFLVVIAGGLLGWMLTRSDSGGSTAVKLPDFVNGPTVPKGTAEAYQFAVDNPDVLKYIPCYCGCGKLEGHDSNLDCFIKSGSGNDIVFDKHAAG